MRPVPLMKPYISAHGHHRAGLDGAVLYPRLLHGLLVLLIRFPGYPIGFVERGMASWYGPGFHGNKTANGERYDMYKLTAAHRTLPLGSVAVVHSLNFRSPRYGQDQRSRAVRQGAGFGPFVGRCPSAWDGRQRNRPGRAPSRGLQLSPEGMGVLRVQVGAFRGPSECTGVAGTSPTRFCRWAYHSDRSPGRASVPSSNWPILDRTRRLRWLRRRLDRILSLQSFVVRDDGELGRFTRRTSDRIINLASVLFGTD